MQEALASLSLFPPDDPKWEWVKDVATPYEYDLRKAADLLTAGGWRRTGDGRFTNAAGERVVLPLWTTPGNEQEPTIIADNWKTLGVEVDLHVLAPGDARDTRVTSGFPGLMVTSFPISFFFSLERTYGSSCPTEANRFAGVNRGCYQSAELDRLADAIRVAIDPGEQRRLYREYVKLQAEDMPALPLFFPVQAWVFREGVTGLKANANHRGPTWNVTQWDIRP